MSEKIKQLTPDDARAWAALIRTVNALDGKDLSRRNSGAPVLDDVGKVGAKLAEVLDAHADALEELARYKAAAEAALADAMKEAEGCN